MKTRVLAVDDNKSLVNMIQEYFKDNKDIEISFVAYDGNEAVNVLKDNESSIDIILLDLIMPKKDGIYVLEKIKSLGILKDVIVVTSFNEEETIRKVSEYGVKYVVLKPFELHDLESKILEVKNKPKGNILDVGTSNLKISVSKILHELGIPSHIKVYQYIREAISLVYERPELIGGITKELYPLVGKTFETSTSRVERAIRHAIEVSWNRGDWDLMEEIFGHSVDIDRAKPTNSEFIVTIADKLRLDSLKVR